MTSPTADRGLDERARAELLDRLRAGDDAAAETLVRRHGGRMLSAARRILPTEEDAQDALQEAFLSAFDKIDTFRGEAQLDTWLHRIAINAALMKLRSLRRQEEHEIGERLPAFTDCGHFARQPTRWSRAADQPVLREELRAVVREGIEGLPDNYRIPLLLRDIEGLSNKEVAEQLGVSVGAAKLRVHRARLALRHHLEPYCRDT